MDDRYDINAAKTKLREGYNRGDVEQILSLFDDAFTDMSDGQATFYYADAKAMMRARLEKLFREYQVELVPVVIDIKIAGDLAIEHGWHAITLTPQAGGPSETKRTRYVEGWKRGPDHGWRIFLFLNNLDQKPETPEEALAKLGLASVETQ